MESIKAIALGIIGGLVATWAVYYAIDLEIARTQYNENVEQCEPIDGCLFDMNCEKYNEMIEEKCNEQ